MKALKYENSFEIGDRIRAYDFQPMEGRNECYLEGVIVDTTTEPGYRAFVVECDTDVFDGLMHDTRIGHKIFVPMETSNDYDGRITSVKSSTAA